MERFDADLAESLRTTLPLVNVGSPVPQRWPRVSRPEVPPFPTKFHQTETASDAPSFMARTTEVSRGVVGPLQSYDYLTHIARRRRATQHPDYAARVDDTAVSRDAPEWIAATLREHKPQPALTRPFKMYRAGARNRVFFTPLTEVDPFTGGPPRALPKPGAPPGYVPTEEARAGVEALYAARGSERFGATHSAEVGVHDGRDSGLLSRPSARKEGRERFGATAAAAIGDMRPAAVLADTHRSEDAAGAEERLVTGARFRAEPPFSTYYAHRRAELGLPGLGDGAVSARWTGLGPAELRDGPRAVAASSAGPSGHALFRALTNAHGERVGSHIALAKTLAAEAVGPKAETARGEFQANFKSGPCHWYNVVR
jgi:hypothetical protein